MIYSPLLHTKYILFHQHLFQFKLLPATPLTKAALIFCFLFFGVAELSVAQITEKQVLDLIAKNDLAIARRKVAQVVTRFPNSPMALYFQALLQKNATKAVDDYNAIVVRFKDSEYAPKALYRMAQFYFARGFYYSARKYFLDVVHSYPESDLREKAAYFAAKCLFAAGKVDSARKELEQIKRKSSSQLLIALVNEDMQALDKLGPVNSERFSKSGAEQETLQKRGFVFSVQIGSYKEFKNAESQKKYFALLGYPVDIQKEKNKKFPFYRLYIGRFSIRKQAKKFAEAFRKRFNIQYKIVKLEEKVP